jgi:hypothetical protein
VRCTTQRRGNAGCSSGFAGIGFGASLAGCANYALLGNDTDTIVNRPTGGRIIFRESNATQMTIAAGGVVSINTLGSAGSTQLCRNASNQISTCSSSLRYKTNIANFSLGLNVVRQLRPINNRPLIDAEYNRAFVLTQYFGYLRRDADLAGFNFWLGVVNQFPLRSPTGQNGMVCAFITSTEYQQRLSAAVTRANQECQ